MNAERRQPDPLDPPSNEIESKANEKANHHPDGPDEVGGGLSQSARRLAATDHAVHFGPERQKQFPESLAEEVVRLSNEAPAPPAPDFASPFVGGEHLVFASHQTVVKHTLAGVFGRILDEKFLLDSRTFQNRRQLFARGALPSEYLRRWKVLHDIFALPTHYLGVVRDSGGELQMAVAQPYIEQDDQDLPTEDDVSRFMEAHAFLQVEPGKIVNPELKEVTWYRHQDGILITDAYPRNFRKSLEGFLVPVDLVVSVVPTGVSQLLPDPAVEWQPDESPRLP